MKILYICTHNRCRSILAEAVTRHLSTGIIEARSAGSHPAGIIHPLTLQYLQERKISTEALRSQSWDDFANWQPDVVITVCDRAAKEQCPWWPHSTHRVHWGLTDPSRLPPGSDDVRRAFMHVIDVLEKRIRTLFSHDIKSMNATTLATLLHELAEHGGA